MAKALIVDKQKKKFIEMPAIAPDGRKYVTYEQDAENIGKYLKVDDDGNINFVEGASGALLEAELVASNAIGSVTVGKTYPIGTALEKIVRDILIKEEAPTITLALTPTTLLYDVVSETLDTIKLSATVGKKTYDIAKVEWFAGSTLIHTETVSVGGTYHYQYTPSTPIKKTTVFKVVVTDVKGKTSNATKTVEFVAKSYNGVVLDTMSVNSITEDDIKALNDTLKNSKKYIYSGINMVYGKVLYAYPQSFGALTSIKDEINTVNYTTSFTRAEMQIDGIDYYVYLLTNPAKAVNIEVTFA